MKPREFDELVRQKFDQNDFEYNPRNWDRLADELDGRAKKRSVIMWWWVPLVGVAASVALAVGIPGLMKLHAPAGSVAKTELVHRNTNVQQQPIQDQPVYAQADIAPATDLHAAKTTNKKQKHLLVTKKDDKASDFVAIRFHEPTKSNRSDRGFNLMSAVITPTREKNKEKQVVVNEGYRTFKPEEIEDKKAPKLSVILSGGINRGNMNSGYVAGATIRRMVNDRVFVEGDVAFANANNTQSMGVPVYGPGGGSSKTGSGGKVSVSDASKTTSVYEPVVIGSKQSNVTYNVSYATVTPSIGYKLMKKMSIAAGPDFQEMLADNRPVANRDVRGNIQEVPMFDIGFIGKTEYAISKNVKAAVSYRKGVNSLITLTDKYIDRDYLQFQVKCAIFNK